MESNSYLSGTRSGETPSSVRAQQITRDYARLRVKIGTRSLGQCWITTHIAATRMIARSAPSPSSPAPSARRYAALGLDRSARPSKGDTMPQMRAGRCSPVLKIHARQTTSDRSSAGFLSYGRFGTVALRSPTNLFDQAAIIFSFV